MRHLAIALAFAVVLGAGNSLSAATIYLDPIFNVQSNTNLVYGTGLTNNGLSTKNLTLDIFRPTQISTPVPAVRPTVVFIHGGGWTSGSKADLPTQMRDLAKYGYNVVSINYRLLGDNPPLTTGFADDFSQIIQLINPAPGLISEVNASVQDAQLALEWLYANQATYGIDPNRVAVSGGSAGATMALALGHLAPSAHIQPRAVISAVGALANITTPFSSDGPPTLLIAGANDNTVPAALVELTSLQMTEAGVYNEFLIQPGTGHTVNWNLVVQGKTMQQHMRDFLYVHAVPEPSSLLLATLGILGLVAFRRQKLR